MAKKRMRMKHLNMTLLKMILTLNEFLNSQEDYQLSIFKNLQKGTIRMSKL